MKLPTKLLSLQVIIAVVSIAVRASEDFERYRKHWRRKPLDGGRYPQTRKILSAPREHRSVPNQDAITTANRIHINNMTCDFFTQPLNHFALPRNPEHNYRQRYCVYNAHVKHDNATILFYTGNESPIETYINHTGLMWEIAESLEAQVVFAEHRYEGQSVPNLTEQCMAYASSIQALADFANLLQHKFLAPTKRPVIAFGGSYGGMLSSWMRMKYPNMIQGAIAASAPIWGFPTIANYSIDTAAQVIHYGLQQSYPPTRPETKENHCSQNLLASWPLIQVLGQTDRGLSYLQDVFRFCDVPLLPDQVIDWARSPWFDLAEGSFPYKSSYIPFALTHNPNAKLPAWPLQAACWTDSNLHQSYGIEFVGNVSDVQYDVYVDGSVVSVDWDQASTEDLEALLESEVVRELLSSVRDAAGVWFNVTKDIECFLLEEAPNESAESCEEKQEEGSWTSLCCNEEMNLVITSASGLGRDFIFWPPSYPRGVRTYQDILDYAGFDFVCDDPEGKFGYPQEPRDPWSLWYETYYGSHNMNGHSNIVFSNGKLDPWSAAGVYISNGTTAALPGLTLSEGRNDIVSIMLEYGGHHTDLMYSSPLDPPSVSAAREVEIRYIRKWVEDYWLSQTPIGTLKIGLAPSDSIERLVVAEH